MSITFKEYLLNEDIITALAPLSDLGKKSPFKVADIMNLVKNAKNSKMDAEKAISMLEQVLEYIYGVSNKHETSATKSLKIIIDKIKQSFVN